MFLLVENYNDFQNYINNDNVETIEQIIEILNEPSLHYIHGYKLEAFTYMNLFATWGPPANDFLGGLEATYRKNEEFLGLYDIVLGDKPTDAKLVLSCQDFYYFASNLLYNQANWNLTREYIPLNLEMTPKEQSELIKSIESSLNWKSNKNEKNLYKLLGCYQINYLKELHKKLLLDELSLEYLLSLNGFAVVGALLFSKKLQRKYLLFFRELIEKREKPSRDWQVVVAVLLDYITDPVPQFAYGYLAEELDIHSLDPYQDWIKSLETDEFGVFEFIDNYNVDEDENVQAVYFPYKAYFDKFGNIFKRTEKSEKQRSWFNRFRVF